MLAEKEVIFFDSSNKSNTYKLKIDGLLYLLDLRNEISSCLVPAAKKKAEYVDCKCYWGLFRDRNVTLRHPIRFHTGQGEYNLERRGRVTQYKGKDHLGWWKDGSTCDAIGGQVRSCVNFSIF